jgi:hypothetical protein
VELRKAWSLEFVTMRKARRKVVPTWSVSCNAEPDETGTCEVINAEASEKGEVARWASRLSEKELKAGAFVSTGLEIGGKLMS